MRVVFTLVLLAICIQSYGQNYFAVANGSWNNPLTWASVRGGTPGSGAGSGYPEAGSTALTEGFLIGVDQDVTCRRILVANSVVNSIYFDGFLDPVTITISEYIRGYVAGTNNFAVPTVSVLENNPDLLFVFTGTTGTLVMRDWSTSAPFNNITFSSSTTLTTSSSFSIRGQMRVQSGTLQLGIGTGITDATASTIIIDNGATFDLTLGNTTITGNGTPTTRFSAITINGQLLIGSSSFANSTNLSMGASGFMDVQFDDAANQLEGWWYQSTGPTSGTLSSTSTIQFSAFSNQNVYARTYANLVLDGSGTKTVPNSGTLNINRMLSIASTSVTLSTVSASGVNIAGDLDNDGNWSPVQLITFNGSTSSVLGGSQSTTFGGGIRVSKTSGGVLTITTPVTIASGTNAIQVLSAGTLNLGSVTTTLNSGNVSNLGTITSGSSGTFSVQSTSTFSGAGSTTLGNLTVGASGWQLLKTM